MTQTQKLVQRAHDAVSRCLIRRLTVPNIYFDAEWAEARFVIDVLAIDRAGTGDVHIVEIKHSISEAIDAARQMIGIPAQFRWVAYFSETADEQSEEQLKSELLSPSSMGRIGTIKIVRMSGDDLGANVGIKPERFSISVRELVAALVASHEPDIQVDNPTIILRSATSLPSLGNQEIESRLLESKRLEESGHPQAAFLLAWSAVEAALRLIAAREAISLDRSYPLALMKSLNGVGALSDVDLHVLLDAYRVRSAITHGFEPGGNSQVSISGLGRIVQQLASVPVREPNA